MKIQIVPLSQEVYEENRDLMNQEIARSHYLARNKPISLEEALDFSKYLEYTPDSVYLVAIHNKRIIGNIYAVPRAEGLLSHIGQVGYLVHQDFQKQRIGTQLMEELLQKCRDTDLEILMAEVVSDNTGSISLLEKFSFQKIGTICKGVKLNTKSYFDLLLFQRFI